MIWQRFFLNLVALASLMLPTQLYAHRPSDAFLILDIEGQTLSGQIDLAIKDLELLIGLDKNNDLKVTWGELEKEKDEILKYTTENLRLVGNTGPCIIEPIDLLVSNHTDGAYATVLFNTSCMKVAFTFLDINYDFFFDQDAQHRGLLRLTFRDSIENHVFSEDARFFHFEALSSKTSNRVLMFCKEGILHIFKGYDHMLFLIALLLPAVFMRKGRKLVPRTKLNGVLWDTTKVVSAFTLAHTISLCLTSFGLITPPPSRLVESLIAFTILLTALNNIVPFVSERRWMAGFGFGLIHGIGYASILSDLGLTGWALAIPLLGFNLGIEVAQLIIIGLFLPLAYLLKSTNFYRWFFLWGGSLTTAVLAIIWMVEQIAQVSILPF